MSRGPGVQPIDRQAVVALAEVYALLRRCAVRKGGAAVPATATADITANDDRPILGEEESAPGQGRLGGPDRVTESAASPQAYHSRTRRP